MTRGTMTSRTVTGGAQTGEGTSEGKREQGDSALRQHDLFPLFHPESVAVIGASSDPKKIGGRTFRYIKDNGFAGKVYPINPRFDEVQGVPTVASLADLPAPADLVFVIVPAPAVVAAVEACAENKARTVVIFSSGFAEMNEEGAALQTRIGDIARESGMRVLGPNCMGVMNVPSGLWGTFTASFDIRPPLPGRVGLISQSGAFGIYAYQLARERGLGLQLWATTGNEVDVDVADCLNFFAQDENTDVLVAYMEGCRNKDKLVRALEAARERSKPVVILKVGRSEIGALAASSHTASLVGSDGVYDSIFRQYGAHRADTIDELVDVAYACSQGRYPAGNKVGLVTVSGGVGVLMADAADQCGLDVSEMPAEAQARLKEKIPFASTRNPVDTTAQMLNDLSLLRENLEVMLSLGGYDAVVFFLSSVGLNPTLMEALIGPLKEMRQKYPDAPVVLAGRFTDSLEEQLNQEGFLILADPTRAVFAIGALARFQRSFSAPASSRRLPEIPQDLPQLPAGPLSEVAAKRLLADAGIPAAGERLAATPDEAAAAAEQLGFPVVLKIVSPDIAHKSEIGGVLLNVNTAAAVRDGFQAMMERAKAAAPEARLEGVSVAQQIDGGVETILGVQRDPVFGPVVMFGLGGIFVEVLGDVALRVAPFGEDEAHAMIREVKGFPLLDGARGRPKADVDALAKALSRLSLFATANADTLETLDINPFVVLPEGKGALALDALIVTRTDD